jgi:hypothetical protein
MEREREAHSFKFLPHGIWPNQSWCWNFYISSCIFYCLYLPLKTENRPKLKQVSVSFHMFTFFLECVFKHRQIFFT